MNQIEWIADDRFFFVGVNQQNDDLIFGVFFYDGANLEIDYIRQMPTIGGYVRDPQFLIDDYNDVILIWNVYNNATAKYDKIQVNKFAVSSANSGWEWSKTFSIGGEFRNIYHAGVTVDEFGNYTLVADVDESENNRYAIISYIKYNGTVIAETKVDETTSVGFRAKTHAVDNSGDCILAVDRQVADQLASFRFNDSNDITVDETKQNLATWVYFSQSDVSHDAVITKFGGGALKFQAPAPVSLTNFNKATKEWSAQAWFAMNGTAHATNHGRPI